LLDGEPRRDLGLDEHDLSACRVSPVASRLATGSDR
jgi:hypothetical protein